jgi:hypothetical protein
MAVDTVEVIERSEHTVLLKVEPCGDLPGFKRRFCIADIRWVEFVRTVPRAVGEVACLMSRLDPMEPPSGSQAEALSRQDRRRLLGLPPDPPPTQK